MPLSPTFTGKLGELYSEFGKFKRTVRLKIKDIPLKDLKNCITLSSNPRDPLIIQVKACKTPIDVLEAVEQKCSLTNISKLECIADEFDCKEALKEFKDCIKTFCNEVRLNVTCGVALTDSEIKQLLKCEKIEFILPWQPEEHILEEINEILWATFEDMYKDVIIISQDRGKSIIVICYIPHTLVPLAVYKAQKNISYLKKMEVTKLTIGYFTVINDKPEKVSFYYCNNIIHLLPT